MLQRMSGNLSRNSLGEQKQCEENEEQDEDTKTVNRKRGAKKKDREEEMTPFTRRDRSKTTTWLGFFFLVQDKGVGQSSTIARTWDSSCEVQSFSKLLFVKPFMTIIRVLRVGTKKKTPYHLEA